MTQKTLGEFIREERDKRDLSLRELARRLKITPPFLSDIELGRRYPSDETLADIAVEFNIAVEVLRQFDHRESLTDFKRLVESNPELRLAFRSRMKDLKAGKLTTDELTKLLTRQKPGQK
jgi:transcriptional regulator with XRE-family HTH domain